MKRSCACIGYLLRLWIFYDIYSEHMQQPCPSWPFAAGSWRRLGVYEIVIHSAANEQYTMFNSSQPASVRPIDAKPSPYAKEPPPGPPGPTGGPN